MGMSVEVEPTEPDVRVPPPRPRHIGTAMPDDRFLNREISWLDFNTRVLALAQDRAAPLLERLKFLAIFASNLDEFFMVRVAGLKRRQSTGLSVRSADGMTPRETLALISGKARDLVEKHGRCWIDEVEPSLAAVLLPHAPGLAGDHRQRLPG